MDLSFKVDTLIPQEIWEAGEILLMLKNKSASIYQRVQVGLILQFPILFGCFKLWKPDIFSR